MHTISEVPDFDINKAQQEFLPTLYQQFIHLSRYSRWLDDKKRRETWPESVRRYIDFFKSIKDPLDDADYEQLYQHIVSLQILPSMRCMWTAGKALAKDNASGYNCAFVAISNVKAFSEAFYLLLVGCFHPDQEVIIPNGTKKISELTCADIILTYDSESGHFSYTHPTAVMENDTSESTKLLLEFTDGSIVKCTENHLFYTITDEWKEAKYLTEEDSILNYHDSIQLVSKEEIEDDTNYWDLNVEGTHSYVLANGTVVHNCGVGYSVERQNVTKLPNVPDELYPSDTTIVIKDSKLGWVQGFNELLSLLYSGRIPQWDLSLVRPAGARLKTFGGRASGPEPLDALFKQTVSIFKKAVGRKLTSIEAHSIVTAIASSVVVGGTRRCLKYDTKVFMKNGSMKQIDQVNVGDWILGDEDYVTFVEVTNVFDNGDQEIVKVHLEDETFFECTPEHRWLVNEQGTGKNVWVMTKDLDKGNYRMIAPIGHDTKPTLTKVTHIEYTGTTSQVYDVEVNHPTHAFYAESENGAVGISHNSALISLSNLSDDRMRAAKSGQWWIENSNFAFANNSVAYTEKPDMGIFMKEWMALYESKSGERGIFNRDGAKRHLKKFGLRDLNHEFGVNPCFLASKSFVTKKEIPEDIICSLDDIDVGDYILSPSGYTQVQNIIDRGVQDVYEFITESGHKLYVTQEHKIISNGIKIPIKEALTIDTDDLTTETIVSRTFYGKHPVVDITVDNDSHSFYVNNQHVANCGEILLRNTGQLCNLSTIIVRPNDTYESFMDKAKYAAIAGTLQSTLTNFRFLSKEWKKNCEEERLLGVSISGIMDHPFLSGKQKTMKDGSGNEIILSEFLNRLRDYIFEVNKTYAEKLGINPSVSISAEKPEGCIKNVTPIKTNIGIISLKDIFEKNGYTESQIINLPEKSFLPITFPISVYDEHNKLTPITELYVNGLAEVYEIEFEDGFVVEMTSNHKLLAKQHSSAIVNFKAALELTDDDLVVWFDSEDVPDHLSIKSIKKLPEKVMTLDISTLTKTYQLGNGVVSHNTSSQLTDSASGIHVRYAPYYIRRVRADKHDPLAKMMIDAGFPCEPDKMKPDSTLVFSFPQKAPEDAIFRHDLSALDQLEIYLMYKENYTTHNPSITVYVKESEWMDVGAWVYKHFDDIIGVTFLPYSDHSYAQAPYEEITKEQYEEAILTLPETIDWDILTHYEKKDHTEGAKELACSGSSCDLY